MEDGSEVRVNYQTKNGHPYRSIGGYLIQKGLLTKEEVSMQSIRRWLDENPDRMREVFNHNPSMVFFKEGDKGPIGCYSVPVTPYRSIATQKRLFPACGIAFITTEKPAETKDGEVISWEPFGRFVMNQDTGGAIVGPGRVDLFTGHGDDAELTAGHMKQPGSLYFLVLKPSVR
jgi:membrane-bound lytic murein transglycosylase A